MRQWRRRYIETTFTADPLFPPARLMSLQQNTTFIFLYMQVETSKVPSTLATSYQATAGIRDVCVSVFSFDPDQILCFFVLSSFVFSFSHPLPVCS